MLDCSRFDLTSREDVGELAELLGAHLNVEWVKPLIDRMPKELQPTFFAYLFARTFGAMSAAIGLENAEAVTQELVKALRLDDAERKRATH